jgi:hypothetical protein
MTSRLTSLVQDAADRRRLMAFVAAGGGALAAGFKAFAPATLERLIIRGGYYFIFVLFATFVVFAVRVTAGRWCVVSQWIRRPGAAGWAILAGTVFAVWSDAFAHKVLFDEYVLQGTAWHMHATKEIGAPIRAYELSGTWLAIDAFLDKRPYFFTFLVSLVHDVTGFRVANAFAVNVALAALTLGLTYWITRRLTGKTSPAILAVALLATLPLFGQNATGASMELHNLAMIAVVMACAILYLGAPNSDRLSLLVLGAALLAQCRYESVLFVVPVAIVVAMGWWRHGRVLLPWPAVLAPLLLVPYVWLNRFVDSKPLLWQLREGDTARFGWRYLTNNLEGAWKFFFNLGPAQANSIWLTLVGIAALAWALARGVRRMGRRVEATPELPVAYAVTAVFAAIIALNLGVLMFYYWSRLDEHITARFALPFCFLLAILAGWLVHSLEERGVPALRIAFGGLVCWLVIFGAPAFARRLYTSQNLVMREMEWEFDRVVSYRRPFLLVTQKATLPFLLQRIPTINTAAARTRGAEIAWHMRQGTFHDVLVTQVVRPSSAQGDLQIDPDDVLPSEFKLEQLEQKRFGGRWIRISRVVEIETEAGAAIGGAP